MLIHTQIYNFSKGLIHPSSKKRGCILHNRLSLSLSPTHLQGNGELIARLGNTGTDAKSVHLHLVSLVEPSESSGLQEGGTLELIVKTQQLDAGE